MTSVRTCLQDVVDVVQEADNLGNTAYRIRGFKVELTLCQ